MSDQPKFPRRPATIFNDFKYDMPRSTKPVEGAKFPATWNWEIGLSGKIMFKCNDGIYGKEDRNAKNKEVEMNLFDRNQLLFVLNSAVNDPEFSSTQVLIRDKLYNNQTGRFNDTPSVLATFTVVRTKNGEIKVNYARGSYEVTFNMNSEKLIMKTKDINGAVEENVGLASRAYTDSFVRFSRQFLNFEEWTRYSREDKKNGGGNGGNGGSQRNFNGGGNGGGNYQGGNGGNGGGQSQAPKDFDDADFDF